MYASVLNRMIFWELFRVFLLALIGLTSLFVIAGLIQQATQMGLSPRQVVLAIPLFIPSTLPYTIPATMLFASCVVYGRLAHDNEIVAVRAAGVHLFQILKPALALGMLTTATTAMLYHTVIPRTQQMLQQQIFEDPEEVLYNALRRERCFRPGGEFEYVLFVKDVQGRRLIDVVLKKRMWVTNKVTGERSLIGYDFVARAKEARLRVDIENGTLFIDSDRLYIYDPTVRGVTPWTGPYPVKLPDNLSGKDIKYRPMALTWDDLEPRLIELRAEREKLDTRRIDNEQSALSIPDPAERMRLLAQDQHFKSRIELSTRQIRTLECEFYMRPALAFGCLVFAMIGCPVGIWANRSDYLSTFVICFLPTVFVYYPLLLAGANMGKDGKIPLGVGCWLANIILGLVSMGLTWRLLRR